MSLLNYNTNITFPTNINIDIFNVESYFGNGTWISIPNYKASWVDFGNVIDGNNLSTPNLFGLNSINLPTIITEVESSEMMQNEEDFFTNINPDNVENKIQTIRSSYCIFKNIYFSASNTTKIFTGMTSASTGIILVDSPSAKTFTFTFSGNPSGFTAYSADFKFSIYEYDETRDKFLKPPVYTSPIYDSDTFIGLMSFNTTIDLSDFADGEYLIKGYFIYPSCTPSFKLLGKVIDTSNLIDINTNYVNYNSNSDWYFAYLTNAPTPIAGKINSLRSDSGIFRVDTIQYIQGVSAYTLPIQASGDYQVNVNGVTLQKNVEYISNPNNFTLLVTLLPTDVLTVAYIAGESNGNAVIENHTINGVIYSGTSPTVGQKIIYNTDSNYYEYWLDSEPTADIIFTLNGVTLGGGDYIKSESNSRRLILFFTPSNGDIFGAYYDALIPGEVLIYDPNVEILFYVDNIPQKNNGYFEAQFFDVSDTNLSTLLFSASTNYVENQSSYIINVTIPPIYYAGQEFWWRLKSVKNYELLTGDIIQTISYSTTYKASLVNNSLYNY